MCVCTSSGHDIGLITEVCFVVVFIRELPVHERPTSSRNTVHVLFVTTCVLCRLDSVHSYFFCFPWYHLGEGYR